MVYRLKSIFLLGGLAVLLIYLGSLFGKNGTIIAFVVAIGLNLVSYFAGDKIVLAMSSAKEIKENEMPELQRLVSEVSSYAGIPKPKIYIIPNASPNAFATGRDPAHSSIAFTAGILDILNANELKGVISHELSHVKNRDVLVATIAATIASAITMIARIIQWGAILGGGRNERNSNPLGAVGMLLMAVLVPVAAVIIQLAVSRSREYLADETGAGFCGNPLYLANALRKLSMGVARTPMNAVNPSTSHLYIVNPFSARGMMTLFSTHPPIEERISRLEAMR